MFGFVIRKIRESRNFSQEYMAAQLHITQAAYSKLESDKTHLSIKKLVQICRVLGIKETDILNNEIKPLDPAESQPLTGTVKISDDYVSFLIKMIEIYEKDNLHLRLTNERLLNIIETRKSF